jgi:hypothetical protein
MGDGVNIGAALSGLDITLTTNAEPEEKLRALMIAAKESGMEVKMLFEYFDKNDDGAFCGPR